MSFEYFISELELISNLILKCRNENDDDINKMKELLTSSSPILSILHSFNRNNLLFIKQTKLNSNHHKINLDSINLTLNNYYYEVNYLLNQIIICKSFKSEHEELQLHHIDDFIKLTKSNENNKSQQEFMLERLNFELQERKRYFFLSLSLLTQLYY
jgi:hypothetical protein